jgi:hypothetical protein
MFQKEIYNGVPNVTVRRVLRKLLHLKNYKLSIVQVVQQHSPHSNIWNTIVLFLKHLALPVAIPGKTRCVLLHYDSSKHYTYHPNKFKLSFQSRKDLFETPCITSESRIELYLSRVKLGVFC